MHEYSIVQALLDRIREETEAHGASAVALIRVALGAQSGVEPELLRSAFELVSTGTACEHAALELRRVEPRWVCRCCGREVATGGAPRCADCGAPARLVAGDEIVLERLELEVA